MAYNSPSEADVGTRMKEQDDLSLSIVGLSVTQAIEPRAIADALLARLRHHFAYFSRERVFQLRNPDRSCVFCRSEAVVLPIWRTHNVLPRDADEEHALEARVDDGHHAAEPAGVGRTKRGSRKEECVEGNLDEEAVEHDPAAVREAQDHRVKKAPRGWRSLAVPALGYSNVRWSRHC